MTTLFRLIWVIIVLGAIAVFAIIIAWFAILFTGHYPRALFDYVVGVADGDCGCRRT